MNKIISISPSNIQNFDGSVRFNQRFAEFSRKKIILRCISETKYFYILLKEAFFFLDVDGDIVIEEPQSKRDIANGILRRKIFRVLIGKFSHEVSVVNGVVIHKIKKLADTNRGNLDSWSFGVLTNGDRLEWIKKCIQSVVAQNIKNYEIIICGRSNKEYLIEFFPDLPIRFIEFEGRPEGEICKKKNLICCAATYENIAVMHDRYMLTTKWYSEFQIYGNDFEVVSCANIDLHGNRSEDWSVARDNMIRNLQGLPLFRDFYEDPPIFLEYSSWNHNVFIPGGFCCIKKSIWSLCKWDERFFWNEKEDVWLSRNQIAHGILPRINTRSVVITFSRRGNSRYLITNNVNYPRPYLIYLCSCVVRRAKKLLHFWSKIWD